MRKLVEEVTERATDAVRMLHAAQILIDTSSTLNVAIALEDASRNLKKQAQHAQRIADQLMGLTS